MKEDCLKHGKICKNGVCVNPTRDDMENYDELFKKCGERICLKYDNMGNCLKYRNIVSICDGDYIIYNCENGDRIDCREKGYERCSMVGLDGYPSDGHCVGDNGISIPTPPREEYDAECLSNKDCSYGKICDNGKCVQKIGIACDTDDECMKRLDEVRCWAYCDNGICKVGKISYPDKPCEKAEWNNEYCRWDVSLCDKNEQRCPENEILTEGGNCICSEGFTRVMGYCIEKGKITSGALAGGGLLLILTFGGLFVFILIVMILLKR